VNTRERPDLYDIYEDVPEDGMVTARIEIVRYITPDADVLLYQATDQRGDHLPLVEALGVLRLTEDTVIKDRMGDDDDEACD
jgi:hypothetical protein